MDHKLEFPTYEEMHEKAVKLAHLIKEKNIKFDKMVVVSRGGFVPASVVAYTWNPRRRYCFHTKLYP